MFNRSCVLSIDSSSSAVEVCVVDACSGEIVNRFSKPITLYSPHEDWFEHDAEEIWERQLEVLNHARVWAVGHDFTIFGIAIANQRETIVAWDKKTLKPICRAISWQDSRNKKFLKDFAHAKDLIREKTGLYLSEYFSASKISWILENVEYDRERIRFGTIDSWLLVNLTKGVIHFTDVTNASRTMCMNLEWEKWDEELLKMFGIPLKSMPQIRPSGSCFGIWKNIPIWGVIGDQQAALLTLGNLDGSVQCTYGTGLFMLRNCGSRRTLVDGTATTVAWKLEGESSVYALENGSFSCGRVLEKIKDMGYFESYEVDRYGIPMSLYLEPVAKRLFLFGDEEVKEPISINFDLSKHRGDVVLKSFINGLLFIVREIVHRFESGGHPIAEFQLGGQISNIDYLAQTQAIALKKKVFVSSGGDHSAIGAALLVLLTLKKISWREVIAFNVSSRANFDHSSLHLSEMVGLDNLYSRLKYYL